MEVTQDQTIIYSLWSKFSNLKLIEIRKIPSGFKNRSFYVKSEDGNEYVLKIYAPKFLTKEQIEERAMIVKTLENQRLPVLEMIQGLNGKYTQEISGDSNTYYATLSKYVKVQFPEIIVNKDIITNLAKDLKRLHVELEKVTYDPNFKKLKRDYVSVFLADDTLNLIKNHFNEKVGRTERLNEFLSFYVNEGEKLQDYFSKSETLFTSIQLNHGDFNLNNIFVENGETVRIFDFDEMVLAPKAWDLALTIYSLDYPEEFYTDELLQIFIEAYFEKSEITKEVILDIVQFMRYRAYNRIARYFTDFQFKENPGGHFTKFRRHLEKFNQIDVHEVYKLVTK